MPKRFWKVDSALKLREKDTLRCLYAETGELLEEVILQEKTLRPDDLSPEDTLVFRAKETKIIKTYVVSRSELATNAKLVSE
jgi:hypothetical protein